MKNFRRLLIALTTAAFLGTLTACGRKGNTSENSDNADASDKLSIVCTIFPEYDWVKEFTAGNPPPTRYEIPQTPILRHLQKDRRYTFAMKVYLLLLFAT